MRANAYIENGELQKGKELRSSVAVAWAADALQFEKVSKLSWKDILKHSQTLEIFGAVLPRRTKQAITAKRCQDLLLANDVEGWAKACWPLREPGEETDEWTCEKPLMRCCIELSTEAAPEVPTLAPGATVVASSDQAEGCMPTPEELAASTRESFFKAAFCDEFWRIFDEAEEDGRVLEKILLPWLRNYAETEVSSDFPDLDTVVAVFRGLLAILSPEPGLMDSGIEDVNYNYPKTMKNAAIQKALPKYAQTLLTSLKGVGEMGKTVWEQRYDMYMKYHGAEVKHSQGWNDLHESLLTAAALGAESVGEADISRELAALEEFTEGLPILNMALRPGACLAIERCALAVATRLHLRAEAEGTKLIAEALNVMTLAEAKPLKHTMLEQLAAHEEARASHGLSLICTTLSDATACTNTAMLTLAEALKSASKLPDGTLVSAVACNSFTSAAQLVQAWEPRNLCFS